MYAFYFSGDWHYPKEESGEAATEWQRELRVQ